MVSNFLKYFEKILFTLEIVFIDLKSPVLQNESNFEKIDN